MQRRGRATTAGKLAWLALAVALTVLATLAGHSTAQISATRHNLLSATRGTGTLSPGSAEEICVFCHTPFGAELSVAIPEWNRTRVQTAPFATFDSLGGTRSTVGSVSIACLSCHDGVTSMSTVISSATGGTTTGDSSVSVSGVSAIGTDLRNDHPVGVQYGGCGPSSTSATSLRERDFKPVTTGRLNEATVWWIDTELEPNGTRQRTDLMLYSRTTDGCSSQPQLEPHVECASCHDPHTTSQTFLRIANTGSAVCLACHAK